MTVAEDATDAGFTFYERLVCDHLCDRRSRQENRNDGWPWLVLEMLGRFDPL